MRISGGYLKGKTVKTPKGSSVRPSSSIVREAIFNILYSLNVDITCVKLLDLFSGTGIISFEFISRAAISSVLIDNSKLSIKYQKENIKHLQINTKLKIIKSDVFLYIEHLENLNDFDIIFMDPPYDCNQYEKLITLLILKKKKATLIIVECSNTNFLTDLLKTSLIKEKKWGKTFILIFK